MSKINRREIKKLMNQLKSSRKILVRDYEKELIKLVRHVDYNYGVVFPKPSMELGRLDNQIEILERIIKYGA